MRRHAGDLCFVTEFERADRQTGGMGLHNDREDLTTQDCRGKPG